MYTNLGADASVFKNKSKNSNCPCLWPLLKWQKNLIYSKLFAQRGKVNIIQPYIFLYQVAIKNVSTYYLQAQSTYQTVVNILFASAKYLSDG